MRREGKCKPKIYIHLSRLDRQLKACAPGAVVSVLHVGDAHGGVADSVVDHRVHRHRHAVLRQHLRPREC